MKRIHVEAHPRMPSCAAAVHGLVADIPLRAVCCWCPLYPASCLRLSNHLSSIADVPCHDVAQHAICTFRAPLSQLLQHVQRVHLALLPLVPPIDAECSDFNSIFSYDTNCSTSARGLFGAAPMNPLPANGIELASLMRDLGYSCCSDATCFVEVLQQFGPLKAPCVGYVWMGLPRIPRSHGDLLAFSDPID